MATIEKASGLVNSLLGEDRIKELGQVVVDEVHMVGETGGRGARLENLLTKLRYVARKFFCSVFEWKDWSSYVSLPVFSFLFTIRL